ncbi:MAG TPA: DUF4124 domain-containing protein [Methylotenera sp.]|nr:DUF4124 domain-containing protein [Methylotenera sp.]HPH05470.1 DUF4124 domain-containing protein [Methylotenera sp.]HPN01393.1 DUF4124 domain-containing protein [Methylotenera sp.]
MKQKQQHIIEINSEISQAKIWLIFAQAFFAVWLCTMCIQVAQAEGKIVKWKDEKGVTHYGDKLPVEAAGRDNSEINKTGVVVKKNNAFNAKTDSIEVESAASAQSKKDSALLASYGSIEEIDLARDRNIKSDELALGNLNQRLVDVRAQLKNNQEKANNFVNRKKNVPQHIADNIKLNQSQITKTQAEILSVESNIAMTKARFAGYKVRYAELKPNRDNAPEVIAAKKMLADLNTKKLAAKVKLEGFLKQAVEAKKTAKEQPQGVSDGIQACNDEIASLDREIIAVQAKLTELTH